LFGASRVVDAFVVANVLPSAIFSMLSTVLSSTIIPHYISVKATDGEEGARHTLRAILTQLLIATIVISIIVIIFASQIIHWFAPTFSPEDTARAIRFIRILIPGIIGASVFLVLQNVFQIYDKWTRPALGMPIAHSFAISMLVAGSIWIGTDVLAWSWLTAFLILPLVLLPGKLSRGFLGLQLRDPHATEFYRLAVPLVIASALGSVVQIVNRYLVSSLPAGELSSLSYAQRVYTMCGELVMATIVPALFPRLTESAVDATREEYTGFLEKTFLGITIVTIAGATILGGLTLPIVEVIFERGAFTPADSLRVAKILFAFSGTLVFFVPLIFVYRTFFANRNGIVPTIGMFVGSGLDIFLCFKLIGPLGTPGLAVASMCGACFQFTLLIIFSTRFNVFLPGRKIFWLYVRGLFTAAIVVIILRWLDTSLRTTWETHLLWIRLLRLGGLVIVGGGLFAILAKLCRVPGYDLIQTHLTTALHRVRSSVFPPSASV